MKPVKRLAVSAILTALCVVILYIGSLVFQLRISFAALAALLPAVAVIHCGYFWACGVYLAAGGLALLLIPDKTCAIWFLLVFGHYGIIKSLIERIGNRLIEWPLKLVLFATCAVLMYFLFRTVFFSALPQYAVPLLFAGLAACFVLYDIAFSALISFYVRRIMPHVK